MVLRRPTVSTGCFIQLRIVALLGSIPHIQYIRLNMLHSNQAPASHILRDAFVSYENYASLLDVHKSYCSPKACLLNELSFKLSYHERKLL